jgi:hypothetical protein
MPERDHPLMAPLARGNTAPPIKNIRPAGRDHQVVTLVGARKGYRRTPCRGCPWITANDDSFPPEAFRHSANTAYDMAQEMFACHESGVAGGHTCAGFLMRGAEPNLSARTGKMTGKYADDLTDGGAARHASYRTMAIANGVAPDDPVLTPCRP